MNKGLGKKDVHKQMKDVDFSLIRYANCWEDPDLLVKGLNPSPGKKHLSIASAGDNSFALLNTNPALVVATDISPVQLYLCELKKMGIQHLDRSSCLQLLGFHRDHNGLPIYKELRQYLSSNARAYWDSNQKVIASGIIYGGKFEKYLHFFSKWLLPLTVSRNSIKQYFHSRTAAEQIAFYDKHWNNWRWRLLFKVFFSKFILGRFGRDISFMNEVGLKVSSYIFVSTEAHLKDFESVNNLFLHYAMHRHFGELLPYYLKEENYNNIKNNIGLLELRHSYPEELHTEFGGFDYANLSNIFEYMPDNIFQTVGTNLQNVLNPQAKIAYWNLMVYRRLSAIKPEDFKLIFDQRNFDRKKDKGFFYSSFFVDQKI